MVLSRKPSCPPGYSLHDAYRTKSGKIVHARCLHNTGIVSPGKSIRKTLKMIKNSKTRSLKALNISKKLGLPVRERCAEGQTLRSGYIRASYDRSTGKHTGQHYKHAIVAPGCIKKRGYVGKSMIPTRTEKQKSKRKTIIMLNDDDHFLSQYGYFEVENKTKENRMESLTKLIKHFLPIKGEMATYNYVIKALNARYILNKNNNPKVAKIFKSDQKTISKLYKTIKMKN
jgi:hypothetical protein